MQRKAAEKGIAKDKHDAAIFANYIQLPGRCGAWQNAFLYYQTLMWNVFADTVVTMREYGRRIFENLKVKEPELTEDFEEEYVSLLK